MKDKYISVFAYAIILVTSVSCKNKQLEIEKEMQLKELAHKTAVEQSKIKAVDDFVSSLSIEQKISQLFLINIEGNKSYHSVESSGALYGKRGEGEPLLPGGCLLFSYNISKNRDELFDFIKSIKQFYIAHGQIPPYIAVDQEGGDVNRLRHVTSTLYSQKKIADTYTQEKAFDIYKTQGEQMKILGFHLNLAPVVEVLNDTNIGFLDTRSFGDAQKVGDYGKSCIQGYNKSGVGVVLKHFPGNSNTDPHTGLPEIRVSKKELMDIYLDPFKSLMNSDCDAVLMSHARVTVTDSDDYGDGTVPACLSKIWVNDILRTEYGYDGIIFSDDIFMGALNANGFNPEKACVMAIEAGVNCIMLSEKTFGRVGKVLIDNYNQNLGFAAKINDSVTRVIKFKIKHGILNIALVCDNETEGVVHKVCVNGSDDVLDEQLWNKSYNYGMEIIR